MSLHFFFSLFIYVSICDMPEVWQIGFQDPATPVLEGIIYFHNDLWFFLIIISTLVFWMLFRCIFVYSNTKNITPSKIVHGTLI